MSSPQIQTEQHERSEPAQHLLATAVASGAIDVYFSNCKSGASDLILTLDVDCVSAGAPGSEERKAFEEGVIR